MKKALLSTIVCLLLLTIKTNAQGYTFSKSTGTYTPITGGSAFAANATINLPFDVTIDGVKNDTLHISTYYGAISTKIKSGNFDAFIAEIQDGTKTYTISGSAGNRIIKLQFDQHKFSHLTWKTDYVTFQIWVYEKDNALEVHMGPSSVPEPDLAYYFHVPEGPAIGLKNTWLVGSPANPTIDTSTGEKYLSGTPANGQIYRFEPITTGIKNTAKQNSNITLYPNPGNGVATINNATQLLQGANINIYNIDGKLLAEQKADGNSSTIDLTAFPDGIYSFEIVEKDGTVTHKQYVKQK